MSVQETLEPDRYNPAAAFVDGLYLGMPSLYYHFYHTGPAYRDLVVEQSGLPVLQVNALFRDLTGDNEFSSQARLQTIKLKYGWQSWNLGFEHEIISASHLTYPDELVDLYVNGNQQWIGQTVSLGPDLAVHSLNSYGLTLSRKIGPLTLGIKPHLLTGNYFAHTPRSQAELKTGLDFYEISLLTDYHFDNVNLIDFEEGNLLKYRVQPIGQWQLFSGNVGFALDLGMSLEWGKAGRLNLSVTDLGRIKWSEDLSTYRSERTTEYSGVQLQNLLQIEQIHLEGGLDSLRAIFDVDTGAEEVTYDLPVQYYGSLSYQVAARTHLALMFHYDGQYVSPLAVAAQGFVAIGEPVSVGVTAGARFGTFMLGVQGLLRLGRVKGYLSMDNVLEGLDPRKSRHFGGRLGLQLDLSRGE